MTATTQIRIETKIIKEIIQQYLLRNPDMKLMRLNDRHYIEAALLCHLGYEVEVTSSKKGIIVKRK